ncbi:bifunctional RNase H/acid phosphatase [Nocardia seriolae]|nr:bifunctional RNase H/acid phosphatase [Nocardia seriolae]MTJ72296.1 bifunctional RNase H/acid phosphatase [Nocardia seriolae]MTJ87015.1 bifunctional RNase H/acid phosphatase [Nocardia seriolae]MTK31011.1 bifunctional RNase H/acid phosphatase [Nocardia seriolae]MTK40052.1 bifunctional RNase H/acid phosphatase [Nocardia seriolae]
MDMVIVEADGGSRGNPGPAGYGAVVWDANHVRPLAERREYLGVTTNNVAEYRGLIAGLEAAAELGAREVAVRMDSKLVVEQMSGRWKVKHESMIPLADRARRLVSGFDSVSFTGIPRKENKHADKLANEAMDDADTVGEVRTALAAATVPADEPTELAAAEIIGAAVESPARVGEIGAAVAGGVVDAGAQAASATPSPGWTGAVGRPTRLLLLRHGQTELSVQRRYSGRGNPPLTELGRSQAAGAAEMLAAKGGIEAIVCSPLGRAKETAEAAGRALGLPVRELPGLIETDFGAWEGMTFLEARDHDPELHAQWLGDASVPAPGGESFDQVRERVEGVRRDLAALYPGANVLVVSHVTPIKTLLQLALGVGPSLLYRLHLDLASLSIAEFYPDGGSSVRLVNDTSYL